MEKIYIVGTTLLLLKLIIKNGYGSFLGYTVGLTIVCHATSAEMQ